MTTGLGIDIVETKRLTEVAKNKKHPFLKNFTKAELNYCFKFKDPIPHLAGTFAAKEAVSKALGAHKNFLGEIEIRRNKNGAPEVFRKNKKMGKMLISIAHDGHYAVAVASHQ